MWAMKEGYDYIIVNFGGWHYAKTWDEAKAILADWRVNRDPDTQCYSRGFYSENLKRRVGLDRWFNVEKA